MCERSSGSIWTLRLLWSWALTPVALDIVTVSPCIRFWPSSCSTGLSSPLLLPQTAVAYSAIAPMSFDEVRHYDHHNLDQNLERAPVSHPLGPTARTMMQSPYQLYQTSSTSAIPHSLSSLSPPAFSLDQFGQNIYYMGNVEADGFVKLQVCTCE